MLGQFKNTKKQGDAGFGYAIAHFCSQGIAVSIPLTDSQDYDLVVDLDGKLKKVQVKTTTQQTGSGHYLVGLRLLGGNSKRNFVHKRGHEPVYDYLFVVTADLDQYLIPRCEFAQHRSSLVLGDKWENFKLMVGRDGFEPPRLSETIYSRLLSTTQPPAHPELREGVEPP